MTVVLVLGVAVTIVGARELLSGASFGDAGGGARAVGGPSGGYRRHGCEVQAGWCCAQAGMFEMQAGGSEMQTGMFEMQSGHFCRETGMC